MAIIKLSAPIQAIQGKLGKDGNISFRTRYGKQHTYVMRKAYSRPASQSQQHARNLFIEMRKKAFEELNDPLRSNYWKRLFAAQNKYVRLDCFVTAQLIQQEQQNNK
ncbi:MAG: hypothetical protein NC038_06400 [Paludibacter sp.]|nr:hypothetical protein [Bacteroidales bacterium]MCM1069521.1 hypothetical protein [Prevotella sp.]MCM1354177.1 hypothetical protein [Bacteroides sp.]MCM1442967.1 hypothetical protein [Muribaculum sp.]MCM1482251.1 hypothetical protein [Paludibacter sp.]